MNSSFSLEFGVDNFLFVQKCGPGLGLLPWLLPSLPGKSVLAVPHDLGKS